MKTWSFYLIYMKKQIITSKCNYKTGGTYERKYYKNI